VEDNFWKARGKNKNKKNLRSRPRTCEKGLKKKILQGTVGSPSQSSFGKSSRYHVKL